MRAAFLEDHLAFEGVGAHEFNRRYDPVDEGEHDASIIATPATMPALFAARSFAALTAGPIRFGGADISHYQYDQAAAVGAAINWTMLVAASFDSWFGFKLSQSTSYTDPTARRSRLAGKASGFRWRLPYHWLSSTTDPEQQAQHYLDALEQTGGMPEDGEPVMLDDEEGGVTVAKSLGWLEYVEARTKRSSAVYTGAYVAGGTIWQSTAIREGKYGPRPMILAAYTTESKARALPGVAAYPWSSWQYSSNGPVPGVVGRCDCNRIDDREVYDLAAGLRDTPAPIEANPAPDPGLPTIPATSSEDDMPAIVTNSDAYDDERGHHDAKSTKWEYIGGERVHIPLAYWNGLGAPEGNPRPYAEIAAVPERAAPAPVAGNASDAPRSFTVTLSGTAQA